MAYFQNSLKFEFVPPLEWLFDLKKKMKESDNEYALDCIYHIFQSNERTKLDLLKIWE